MRNANRPRNWSVPVDILVWPGFSVVGIEIAEQLRFMKGVKIFAGTSEVSHPLSGMFDGVLQLPNLKSTGVKFDRKIFRNYVIFPAHDYVLDFISNESMDIRWIGSCRETIRMSRNKTSMYKFLRENLSGFCPDFYETSEEALKNLPLYTKPNSGYGSQGHLMVVDINTLNSLLDPEDSRVFMEVLSGEEYTVECLTSIDGTLGYARGRKRLRVRMGTSLSFEAPNVETRMVLEGIANLINESVKLNGPWYFQVKERSQGKNDFKILEISTRLAGSSVWARANGVNLAEIAIWNFRNVPVHAIENTCEVIVERDLSTKIVVKHNFDHIYIDLDDTILLQGKVNHWAIAFLIQEKNRGKEIHLITKSLSPNLNALLISCQLDGFFNTISHLSLEESKATFMKHSSSIFIDDSFSERKSMLEEHNIPCYGPEIFQLLVI